MIANFQEKAVAAAKQWKFKPYLLNGNPVVAETVLTLDFKP